MAGIVTETFFLPAEVDRRKWSAPAEIYNLYRALLGRSATGNVFVPIRSMQFMGVMDRDEIVFVDSQSYAVSGNEGGRLILVSWKFASSRDRVSLTDPVPCDVVFYGKSNNDIQLRLIADFRQALMLLDQRYRNAQLPVEGAKILRL